MGPVEVVELGDGARFVGLEIFEVKVAHQVVVAPNVFADQMQLEDVVALAAFLWPVDVAEILVGLAQFRQHHNDGGIVFPDHL